MADDASIGGDDDGLRDDVPPVHQRERRLAVGPPHAEAEFEITRELLDAVRRSARVFSRQTDELDTAPGILFADLLVLRHGPHQDAQSFTTTEPAKSARRKLPLSSDLIWRLRMLSGRVSNSEGAVRAASGGDVVGA